MTGTSMLVVAALLAILNQKKGSAKLYQNQHNCKDLYDDHQHCDRDIHGLFIITCVVADIMIRMRKRIAKS